MTVQRYLAVLGAETARPPPGLHSGAVVHHTESEDETACRTMLATAFDATKEQAEMKYPGKGCGFGFMRGPYCSYATKDGVHILFSGEVSEWPGIDAVEAAHDAFLSNVKPAEDDDAHWLLDFYRSFSNTDSTHDNEEILQKALECLSCIKGSFAFVIYDSVFHRLLAARDAEGVQPMYWGSTSDGKLMFGSAVEDLKPCDPTATMFPAGTLFASIRHTKAYNPGPEGWVIEGEDFPGDLLSFVKADEEHWKSVKAIPRITSKGCVSGAVYKVSSQPDMEHPVPK